MQQANMIPSAAAAVLALHHLHGEFALDVFLVTAIGCAFGLHGLAGRMQVSFFFADADVVAPGQRKQTKFVPVGPHFIENGCEVANPREDPDLQAATVA